MINFDEIKKYGILISDEAFLSDDTKEENPVEVYFYDDNVFWCKYKDVNKVRAFVLTDTLDNIAKSHKDEILKSTLGTFTKKDEVTLRDVFLHGGYINEVNLDDYNLRFVNGKIYDVNDNVILNEPHLNMIVVDKVLYIFKHSLSLWAVDEYLLNCSNVTQDDREIIVEALNKHLSDIKNNLLLHATMNQMEADFDDNDYESLDELITKLFEIPQAKDLLVGYLSDTALKNWKLSKTNIRY
jgi:hypothetical protein